MIQPFNNSSQKKNPQPPQLIGKDFKACPEHINRKGGTGRVSDAQAKAKSLWKSVSRKMKGKDVFLIPMDLLQKYDDKHLAITAPSYEVIASSLLQKVWSKNERVSLEAIKILLDREEGKAGVSKVQINQKSVTQNTIQLVNKIVCPSCSQSLESMSDNDVRTYMELSKKYEGNRIDIP